MQICVIVPFTCLVLPDESRQKVVARPYVFLKECVQRLVLGV